MKIESGKNALDPQHDVTANLCYMQAPLDRKVPTCDTFSASTHSLETMRGIVLVLTHENESGDSALLSWTCHRDRRWGDTFSSGHLTG